MRGQLITLAYRAAARIADALPERSLPAAGRIGGRIGGWPQRANRKMAARHQARVLGHADPRAVNRVFEWYGRYWLEILRLPEEVRRGTIMEHFDAVGLENIDAALARGNGVALALPHLGGWEWAAAWMTGLGYHMLAVVESLEPPELREWFEAQRESYGLEIVALGDEDMSKRVLKALRDNRIVRLLSDRDLTGDGVEVEFFGERTTLPAGPATLSLRTGAALMPTAVYFGPGREHHAVIGPEIPVKREGRLRDDIARLTQDMATVFEDLIRRAPDQWHLLQPNWPSDRE